MKKKSILLIFFIFLLLSLLFSNIAFAQEQAAPSRDTGKSVTKVFEVIREFVGWIPDKLSTLIGGSPTEEAIFYGRFILWVLLFTILYFVSSKFIFKGASKGIQITIPFIIALMGVVLIPGSVISGIFTTYTAVAAIILWLIPIVGALFINHLIKDKFGDAKLGKFIKGMAFILAGVMLSEMSRTLIAEFATTLGEYVSWVDFASVVFIALGIFQLVSMGLGGGKSKSGGLKSWAGNKLSSSWSNFGNKEKSLTDEEEKNTKKEKKETKKEKFDISKMEKLTKRDIKDVKGTIEDLEKVVEIIEREGMTPENKQAISKKMAEAYKWDTEEARDLTKIKELTAKVDKLMLSEYKEVKNQAKILNEIKDKAKQYRTKNNLSTDQIDLNTINNQLRYIINLVVDEINELRKEIEPREQRIIDEERKFRELVGLASQDGNIASMDQHLRGAIKAKQDQWTLLKELEAFEEKLKELEKTEHYKLLKEIHEEEDIKKVLEKLAKSKG